MNAYRRRGSVHPLGSHPHPCLHLFIWRLDLFVYTRVRVSTTNTVQRTYKLHACLFSWHDQGPSILQGPLLCVQSLGACSQFVLLPNRHVYPCARWEHTERVCDPGWMQAETLLHWSKPLLSQISGLEMLPGHFKSSPTSPCHPIQNSVLGSYWL